MPAVNASSFLPIFSPSCSLTYRKYVVKKALYYILLALVAHKLVCVCAIYIMTIEIEVTFDGTHLTQRRLKTEHM